MPDRHKDHFCLFIYFKWTSVRIVVLLRPDNLFSRCVNSAAQRGDKPLLPVSLNHVSSSFFFYNKLICHYLSLIISLVTDAHTHDSQISRPLNGLLAAGKLPQVVRMIIRRAFWKVLHFHQRCCGLCRVQSEKKELKWLSSVEIVSFCGRLAFTCTYCMLECACV